MPTIAIHQPNFCPWLPFFQKMQQSDIFVIMGNCQWSKGGYQNRFYHNGAWNTMSVSSGLAPVIKKRYINPVQDWKRITDKYPILHEFDEVISWDLWRTNTAIIVKAANLLNIKTKIVFDYPTDLKGTDNLVDICIKNGATKYLSGISGKNYLDKSLFDDHKIELEFQDEMKMDKRSLVELL